MTRIEAKGAVTEADLTKFVGILNAKMAEWWTTAAKFGHAPAIEVMTGAKFARLVLIQSGSRSAYGFIDLSTGDLLKSDGWKRPAKGVRGNIHADEPLSGCTPYGMAYFK